MTKPFIQYKNLLEIVERRTYNQKVYDNSLNGVKGSRRYRIHCRHLHYKDNQGKLQNIDTTLLFDNIKKAWRQNKASYHCIIPEYADGVFKFFNAFKDINHTIKAIPQCNHIKGTKTPNQRTVIYKGAFGIDIDLRVDAYWAGLRKIVVINKKPQALEDLRFDFEVQLPEGSKVLNKLNKEWDRQTKLPFKDKTLRIGKSKKYSYFKNARVWDSSSIDQSVDIELYTKNGKVFLRKTITKELLAKATYPLYTDHPTTYYAGAGDGYVRNDPDPEATSWNACHDAEVGTDAYPTTTFSKVYIDNVPATNDCDINRAFLPFDTAGITDTDIIDAASLYIWLLALYDNDNDAEAYLNIVQTSQASVSTLSTADYNQCGAVDNPTKGSDDDKDITGLSTGAYINWALNAAGKSWINKTGHTKLGIREGHDITDTPGAGDVGYTGCVFSASEWADTDQDPYLDVTTSPGVNPYPVPWLKKKLLTGYHCFMNAYLKAKVLGYEPLKLPDGTVF